MIGGAAFGAGLDSPPPLSPTFPPGAGADVVEPPVQPMTVPNIAAKIETMANRLMASSKVN